MTALPAASKINRWNIWNSRGTRDRRAYSGTLWCVCMYLRAARFTCLHGRCTVTGKCACATYCDFLNVWIGVCRGGYARGALPSEIMTGASCCSQTAREREFVPRAGYPTFNLISGLRRRCRRRSAPSRHAGKGWKKHSLALPLSPSFVFLLLSPLKIMPRFVIPLWGTRRV